MTGLPGRERSSTVSSAVWIQCTNVTDGQTDGRTDTGRQQKPPLGIASRSNNYKIRSDSNCLLHDLCNSELVSCGCSWPQRYFSNKKYVLLLFVYCFVVRKRDFFLHFWTLVLHRSASLLLVLHMSMCTVHAVKISANCNTSLRNTIVYE